MLEEGRGVIVVSALQFKVIWHRTVYWFAGK
jgi:hypothetical protein